MLTLITFPPSFGEPSHSPFCAKAMVLLHMSGQRWQREDVSNPSPMPHGKLPVLRTNDGLIPDSEFIEDWLTKAGADFYPGCTEDEKALGKSLIRVAEESLRLALVHDRWLDDRVWPHIWPVFFAEVPRPLRRFVSHKIRKSMKAGLLGHGIARMSSEERLRKVESDLDVLGQVIGSRRFILGDAPTAVDAAVLPVLSMIDGMPFKTELVQLLRSKSWVQRYLQQGRATLYEGLARR